MIPYTVKKVLNNNVLIAAGVGQKEVVLIGKGIGFGKKRNDTIAGDTAEKLFVLRDEQEQMYYKNLLPHIEEDTLQTIISALEIIRKRSDMMISEQVHVALTDHILFAITRLIKGMTIANPFLSETKALYPVAYEIAAEVVAFINDSIDITLPEEEIGFIALHVHSAMTDKDISDMSTYSSLVHLLVGTIEQQLRIKIDPESIDYIRLIRHLRYTIERVMKEERLEEPEKITSLLKSEYPACYNLSWKLIKIMQQTLKKPMDDAEAVYLTMHLQRLKNKNV